MTELLKAAKDLIYLLDFEDYCGTVGECEAVNRLIQAVERAEKPSDDFMKWWRDSYPINKFGIVPAFHGWKAGQLADRARIKQIITYQFSELVSDLSEVMEMIDDD